jgi:hypothetical protein
MYQPRRPLRVTYDMTRDVVVSGAHNRYRVFRTLSLDGVKVCLRRGPQPAKPMAVKVSIIISANGNAMTPTFEKVNPEAQKCVAELARRMRFRRASGLTRVTATFHYKKPLPPRYVPSITGRGDFSSGYDD